MIRSKLGFIKLQGLLKGLNTSQLQCDRYLMNNLEVFDGGFLGRIIRERSGRYSRGELSHI